MYYFVNKDKYCQICLRLMCFYFTLLFALSFAMKQKSANKKSLWNILVFCNQWKVMPDLNMSHWKNVWFCLVSIVCVNCSHKTEKFQCWKSLKYLNIFYRYGFWFEYISWKIVWFCFILIFRVHFSPKTAKFQF